MAHLAHTVVPPCFTTCVLLPLTSRQHDQCLNLKTCNHTCTDLLTDYDHKAETSSSAIAETALEGELVLAKSGRLERKEYSAHINRSIFNHCDVNGQQSYRIRWKNTKEGLLRLSRSFKVIEDGINRKPVCDFLLVINTNKHPSSYRFGVIAAYCSNFGHFAFEPTFGDLGATYDVHLRLIEKRVVDFLLVILNFFARCYRWGATSENRLKIGDFAPTRPVWPNISDRRGHPHQPFFFLEN